MHTTQICFGPTVLLLILSIAGCVPSGPVGKIEKVVPVTGTLTYQGRPLEHYQVLFMPDDGRRVATGVSDAAGKFSMGTNTAGDGAPPGASKVAIVFVGPPSTATPGSEVPVENPAQLPQPKIRIPEKYGNPETSGLTQDVPEAGLADLKIDLK